VQLWEAATGKKLGDPLLFPKLPHGGFSVLFSPDSQTFVTKVLIKHYVEWQWQRSKVPALK
jgi:hypothetical protein